MQKERVFRKRYIFIVLAIAFFGYLIKVVLGFSPYEQTIIRKESIGEFNTLYVTEGSAGATTKNTYKYYLYPSVKTEKEFLADVRDYPSVLFTSDPNVKIQLKGRYLYFTVKGTIYSFTNQSDSVFIYLNSTPF